MSGFRICCFSDDRDYRIEVDGKVFAFEFSERFGPAVIGKRGDILDVQPRPRSRFWVAVSWWKRQGKRVNADGLCVWHIPRTDNLYHISGRTYVSESIYNELRRDGKIGDVEPTTFEQPL